MEVLILGAGPAGLSAAIAHAKISTPDFPVHVTLFELRSGLQTLGGSVHMTPRSLQHLDQLGVYKHLRPEGITVRGLDLVPIQTGTVAATVQKGDPTPDGIIAMRLMRYSIVEAMLKTAQEEHSGNITVRCGMRVVSIQETEDKVMLEFENGDTVKGDVLLGCDGLHSATRELYVEPDREKIYSRRVALLGFYNPVTPGSSEIRLANGDEILRDTTILKLPGGSLILSYFEPSRSRIYAGAIISYDEPGGDLRDGWRAMGADHEKMKKLLYDEKWAEDKVSGLASAMQKIDELQLWPIYYLGPGGTWSRGRVLLLGEAAHSMPPQGESIGFAIEDGVLLAHMFGQHRSKAVQQVLDDYATRRRPVINKLYDTSLHWWNDVLAGPSS